MIDYDEAQIDLEYNVRNCGINGVKKLKVLDLGCGSGKYTLRDSDSWPPAFALLCAQQEAQVVAVDQYSQHPEHLHPQITYVRADILEAIQRGQLSQLPELRDGDFKIIHSSNFVGHNYDPNLGLTRVKRQALEQQLILQLRPLLADGGIMDLGLRDNNDRRVIIHR